MPGVSQTLVFATLRRALATPDAPQPRPQDLPRPSRIRRVWGRFWTRGGILLGAQPIDLGGQSVALGLGPLGPPPLPLGLPGQRLDPLDQGRRERRDQGGELGRLGLRGEGARLRPRLCSRLRGCGVVGCVGCAVQEHAPGPALLAGRQGALGDALSDRLGGDGEEVGGLQRAIAADKAEDARVAERQRQREAEQREAAQGEVSKVRATVERDLRLGGAPESQVRSLADDAMKSYHLARARETAERGAAAERELKDFFRRQASTALRFDIPGEG